MGLEADEKIFYMPGMRSEKLEKYSALEEGEEEDEPSVIMPAATASVDRNQDSASKKFGMLNL